MKDAFKCLAEHLQPCAACPENIENKVNKTIQNPIKRSASINMDNYSSQHAKRKFLQMPLAAINVKTGEKESKVFVVDKHANLTLLRSLLRKLFEKNKSNKLLSKETFKALIQSCNSDAEWDKLRYAVAETTGFSQKQLAHQFGISNPVTRKAKVEHALARALEIRKNVELSQIKEEAVLMSLGFDLAKINSDIGTTDSSSSKSESDPNAEVENDSLQQEFLQTNANSAQFHSKTMSLINYWLI